ncbi:hypothetical protein EMPG_10287 [Blastomyces silverae]|uniref:Myb-like domain-containing protein n=1 Tax=Blastomyces silverae TaxID=2060906 RepID=A0A0H1B5K0_9EURO|nr:hypothetical protein EMPG_10287 [Blastomyces silverae]
MVNWDAAADRALLLNVIDPVAKPNWERVAASMGDGFTAEACRQHFRKLKTEALGEGSPAATTSTPTKTKRKANEPNGTDDTPTKKPRARKPKAAKSEELKAELPTYNTDSDVKKEASIKNEAVIEEATSMDHEFETANLTVLMFLLAQLVNFAKYIVSSWRFEANGGVYIGSEGHIFRIQSRT